MSEFSRKVLTDKGINPDAKTPPCPSCGNVVTQEQLYDAVNSLPSGVACRVCHHAL